MLGRFSTRAIWVRLTAGGLSCVLWLAAAQGQETAPVDFELAPKTLQRSGVAVWSLDVSPDGQTLATGDEAGRVLLRETATGKTRHVFTGHEGAVSAVAFSPSGQSLASAGQDGQVRVWHVASGRLQATLTGQTNWITCLAFGPTDDLLATGGYDKTVRLWNVHTGVQSALLEGHAATVRTLAFSPDGQTLASAGDDGSLKFWNLLKLLKKNRTAEEPLPPQETGLKAIAFSPDGLKFLTVPDRGTIKLWDLATKKDVVSLTSSETGNVPSTAAFSSDGLSVLVGTQSGRVEISSATTGKPLQTLEAHQDQVTGLALAPDGKTLFTGGLDGQIQAWPARLPLELPLAKWPMPSGQVWAIALSPDNQTLAVGGKGGFVELWDLSTGKLQTSLTGFSSTVDCLERSADGKHLAACGWRSNEVVLWNLADGKALPTITLEDKVRAIAFSPDNKTLAAGCSNHQVYVIDIASGKIIRTLSGHDLPVYDVAFSPDGQSLATSSGEWTERKPGRVLLHNAADGQELARFDKHAHAVRSLAFLPDGTALASLSQEGTMKLHELPSLREAVSWPNGLDARLAASSADGLFLAVGLQDGSINLWNREQKAITRRFKSTDDVFDLRFSRDGSTLFAANGNEYLQLWKLTDSENSMANQLAPWLSALSSQADPKAAGQPQETP